MTRKHTFNWCFIFIILDLSSSSSSSFDSGVHLRAMKRIYLMTNTADVDFSSWFLENSFIFYSFGEVLRSDGFIRSLLISVSITLGEMILCLTHLFSLIICKTLIPKCIFKKHLNVSLFCHMRSIESNYFSSKKMRWINCKDKCKEIKNISSDLIDYYDSSYKPLLWNETFKSWLIYGWSVWLCCEKYEGFNALYCSESGQFV